jgi:predicted dehydrogenase
MAISRRSFIGTGATVAAASLIGCAASRAAATTSPATSPATTTSATTRSKNDRPGIAVVGCGGIARWHGQYLKKHGDVVAVCDVDKGRAASYNKEFAGDKAIALADHRKVLERPDVDVLLIATPDHWHSKITADALRAGKDVYCEKPLTLTIDEGRVLCRVVRETSGILQVGTQQRSQDIFLTAVGLVHAGRLGKIRQAIVVIGNTPKGSDLKTGTPPAELDWEMWLGQTPKVDYIPERAHYNFRWWYEYSGGIVTDWGAHHVDVAQWAIAPDLPGPTTVEPMTTEMPVRYEKGWPTVNNAFNTAARFNIKCTFANGVEMFIRDKVEGFPSDNGILIEGDGGWLFVNRDKLTGTAVDRMKTEPLREGAVRAVPKTPEIPHEKHLVNFLECVRTRAVPTSDVWTHHRHLTTCHLANIAMRLGRKIQWDASAQKIVGDGEADAFQSRAQRKGYEIVG